MPRERKVDASEIVRGYFAAFPSRSIALAWLAREPQEWCEPEHRSMLKIGVVRMVRALPHGARPRRAHLTDLGCECARLLGITVDLRAVSPEYRETALLDLLAIVHEHGGRYFYNAADEDGFVELERRGLVTLHEDEDGDSYAELADLAAAAIARRARLAKEGRG